MKLLALDTATEACSAALMVDDTLHSRFELAPRAHAQMILPMIDEVLGEARINKHDLDALAFGRGPGSFTGVRVAASVAQGIAFGLNIPVIPVSTLSALALQAMSVFGSEHVLAAIDARMKEVYWCEYRSEHGLPVALTTEQVIPPAEVPLPSDTQCTGAGSGWEAYRQELDERLGSYMVQVHADLLPRAEEIALIARPEFGAGRVLPPEQAQPVYLRDNVARKKGEQAG